MREDASRTCVVGAGPAGLATIRALGRHGVQFDCFERHDDVGGIWDQRNEGSPMYDSAHFISSRSMSGFHGYPMPEDLPDYPDHRQVLTGPYTRALSLLPLSYSATEGYALMRSTIRGWSRETNRAPAIGRKPAYQAGFRVLADLKIAEKGRRGIEV